MQTIRISGLYDQGDKRHQMGSVYDVDGLAPALDTMMGGNREPIITEIKKVDETKKIKIRQATEQGFALCEIGGGSGLGLSHITNTKGKSNRERKDMSDTDNGEYP